MIIVNRKVLPLLLLVLLLCIGLSVVSGCGSAKNAGGADLTAEEASMMESGSAADRSGVEPQQGEKGAKPRFVIRNASMELTVPDTRKTVARVEKMVEESGGLVSSCSVYELREGQYAADLNLRIPENDFDSFLARLEGIGKSADIYKDSEDVTLPYLDLKARINNLKAEESRLREILTEARNVEEILSVERELFRVRGEIESLTAEFTHLQDQVSFSTVRVSIKEEAIASGAISQKPFSRIGERMKEALFRSFNFISSAAAFLLVALTALLPLLLVLAPVVLIIVWLVRRSRHKKDIASGGQPPALS